MDILNKRKRSIEVTEEIRKREWVLVADTCGGGLPTVKMLRQLKGTPDFLFLGDIQINPLGLKTKEFASQVAESWFYMASELAKAVLVVPCNTASIAGRDVFPSLSQKYSLPVITTIEAIGELIRLNGALLQGCRVAVMGTKSTIASGVYQSMIRTANPLDIISIIGTNSERVVATGCNNVQQRIEAVREDIGDKKEFDAIILACSCFAQLKSELVSVVSHPLQFLDPAAFLLELVSRRMHDTSINIRGHSELWICNTGEESSDQALLGGCATIMPEWPVKKLLRLNVTYGNS